MKDEKTNCEKVLVVEDNFVNMICAVSGLGEYKDITDVECVGLYDLAMEKLDQYKPTCLLVDMNFPRTEGSGTEYLGREFGKELKRRGIPYLYVTGISEEYGHGHTRIIATEVMCENDEGNLETLLRFDTSEKDQEVWQGAYDKMNELYGRDVE